MLITGASAGIGRAAVAAFLAAGARVVGVARSADALAAAGPAGDPARFLPVAADVGDAASMAAMAARVEREAGLPDVIVANAGVGLDALFADTRDEHLRSLFEVNVFGVYRTVRPFLPGMLDRGSGRILLVSSIVGKRGIPHYSAYSASKFALHGMAEALRVELWGSGVTVGVVCPSSTATTFRDHAMREGPPQPARRPRRHSPDSVARAIVRMARSRRRETVLSAEAKLLAAAARLAPGLVDRLLARTLTRR